MLRAAIIKVVAVNAGNHHMTQPQLGDRLGHISRFRRIKRQRHTGCDIAKGAGTGAGLAHNHESGVLLFPALTDIRARRFLAHGDQIILFHNGAGFGIGGRARRFGANPTGLAQDSAIRPVLLFRMARLCGPLFGFARQIVNHNSHGFYISAFAAYL